MGGRSSAGPGIDGLTATKIAWLLTVADDGLRPGDRRLWRRP